METVTLRGEDFSKLHNSLCDLRNISDRSSDSLAREINPVIYAMEQALKDAYEQDNEQFDSKMAYYREFQRDNGLTSIWSIYELPMHGFLGKHPFPSDAVIVYRDHWGDQPVHCAVWGDTWADVYRAADNCIRNSGDDHHCFIEALVLQNGNEIRLTTGS